MQCSGTWTEKQLNVDCFNMIRPSCGGEGEGFSVIILVSNLHRLRNMTILKGLRNVKTRKKKRGMIALESSGVILV